MAGAATSHCAANAFCYIPEVHGTNLVMSASGYGAHNTRTHRGRAQNDRNTAADFLAAWRRSRDPANAKFFEYAPKGHVSGYCVSEPHSHAALVLQSCNGSANQAWDATSTSGTYEWINEATGDAMTDPGHNSNHGNAGTQLTGENANGAASQLWDAVD